ncbi:hypothetical protein MMC25_007098 [Agyrium rufum]|nr:hypothetical protein [Agyrium rufum]
MYATGSTTKSFTAAAMSMIIDDTAKSKNPITWTTPISSIIRDDYVLTDAYATTHLTIEDALSHRTGLPSHDYALISSSSPQEAVRRLRYLPFSAEIRTKFQYCNLGFVTISHVIETITGKWLGDFFRERIWEPLMMTSTYFSVHDVIKANKTDGTLARGYFYLKGVNIQIPEPYLDSPAISGAGNIFSTVEDYAKYLQSMLYFRPPISLRGHIDLRTPRSIVGLGLVGEGPVTYSLGWDLRTYYGAEIIEHQGGLPGFSSYMLYLPSSGYGFVLMANAGEIGNIALSVLMGDLLNTHLRVPERQQIDWMSIYDYYLEYRDAQLNKSRENLYPDAPPQEEAMLPSLPIEDYAGTYTHPAYETMKVEVLDLEKVRPGAGLNGTSKVLHAKFGGFLKYDLSFSHVNGEHWLVWESLHKGSNHSQVMAATKAEFEIGSDGRVKQLGAVLEAAMGDDKMWFTKVA